MIKSVKFPKTGKGYIYDKFEEPKKPDKSEYRHGSRSDYDKDLEEYELEKKYYDEHKGEYKLKAGYNLVGKIFKFQDNKINVLFGPNASGKTTILRSIAAHLSVNDGFTSIAEPFDLSHNIMNNSYNEAHIKEYINKKSKNTSSVNWDGTPLYFDNFTQTMMNSYGEFGAMTGSVLESVGEEMQYLWIKDSISSGQNSIFLLNKIIAIASKEISMKDILDKRIERFRKANSLWQKCGNIQYEYFSKIENFEKKVHPTLMFDEMDKSLDIETVWTIYTKLFPEIISRFGNQIITVSHNPLILTEDIYNNENYNIISIDPKYTERAKSILKNTKF